MKSNYFLYLLLLSSFLGFTQETNSTLTSRSCGSNFTKVDSLYLEQNWSKINALEKEFSEDHGKKLRANPTSIPVKIHMIRSSSGVSDLNETQLHNAIEVLNQHYEFIGLNFFFCGDINYIDDDNLYDFQQSDELEMASIHNIENVINIYFTNSITNNSGIPLCGYTYYPGGPLTVVMNNFCTTDRRTLSHEIGHFFGLPHTHGNSNSSLTDELVDGSNCSIAGDRFCDTAADPQLGSSIVDQDCIYFGDAVDANGDVFDPDTANIMSYSLAKCATMFTEEQYARMSAVHQISRQNLACPAYNADFIADTTKGCTELASVNFSDHSTGAISWQWDVDGDNITDYTEQNPTHTYKYPGNYDVRLTILGEEGFPISRTKSQYIELRPQEANTDQITLTLVFDNLPFRFEWRFVNDQGEVLYEGRDYDFTYAGETLIETFDVNPNQCYEFILTDLLTNIGLCCLYGEGSYELTTNDGEIITRGDSFEVPVRTRLYTGKIRDDFPFDKELITLYPNPATDRFVIAIPEAMLPEEYVIYNTLGQPVMRNTVESFDDLEVNISELKRAMYFIQLIRLGNTTSIPFIKD